MVKEDVKYIKLGGERDSKPTTTPNHLRSSFAANHHS